MGEIADMMIEGILDSQTGEFINDEISRQGGSGFPRTMNDRISHKAVLFSNRKNSKQLNGVAKFLTMRGVKHDDKATDIIRTFCKEELSFEGTLKECAKEIQKDFSKFVNYMNTKSKLET